MNRSLPVGFVVEGSPLWREGDVRALSLCVVITADLRPSRWGRRECRCTVRAGHGWMDGHLSPFLLNFTAYMPGFLAHWLMLIPPTSVWIMNVRRTVEGRWLPWDQTAGRWARLGSLPAGPTSTLLLVPSSTFHPHPRLFPLSGSAHGALFVIS